MPIDLQRQLLYQEIERGLRERFDVAPEDAARIAPEVQEMLESHAYLKITEESFKNWLLRARIKELIEAQKHKTA